MKNDHLPIIQALKGRSKPKGDTSLPQFEAPRTFEIQHSEIPGLPGRKVGEHISVTLQGHVHSQSNDGRAVMHVSSVKPDSEAMTKEENPEAGKSPKEIRVQTQESHS